MAGLTAFLVIALLGQVSVEAKKCYNCGYRTTGDGESEKLPELPFCGDFASSTDNSADCGTTEDCCASLKEYLIKVDEVTGENSTVVEGRHGCAQDLDHLAQYSVTCKEQGQSCFEVDRDSLEDRGNTTLTKVEICLCDAELCNNDDPIPEVPTDQPTANPPQSKECYDCGYMCQDFGNGDCTPKPIGNDGHINFCSDHASMGSMTKKCTGADECCGSVVEYISITNQETGKVTTDKLAYHGCEKDLANAFDSNINVLCNGHTNSCYNVSRDDIHDDVITRAEACFCEGDRCNDDTPDLPDTLPGTTTPAGPSKTCYNCGYKCTNMVDATCTPEPIDEENKVPFCKDTASFEDHTIKCGGGDECCGALREYFEMTNEESGKTTVDMITFHGCEKNLAGAMGSNQAVICKDHANACYNMSKEDIVDEFVIQGSACFCEGDLCNKELPGVPFPNGPGPGPTANPPQSKECYDCGYMCQDFGNGKCDPKPIGEDGTVHFCSDHATMASMTKKCTGGDECCGSLVEYISITNNKTGVTTTDKIAYHGCEKDLAGALGAKFDVVCGGHTNACYNISREEIQDDFLVRAEACFCEGDRCNDDTPDLPDTVPGGGSTFLTASLITLLGALLILN